MNKYIEQFPDKELTEVTPDMKFALIISGKGIFNVTESIHDLVNKRVDTSKLFNIELLNIIQKLMEEHNNFAQTAIANYTSGEFSSSGNFTNPENNKKYGYKFTIGDVDFFKNEE